MNVIAEIQRINDLELQRGITHTPASWHAKYRDSAWVYAGNLPHALTEGDVLCILSQFGEVEDIHLSRDADTGKSRGFAFVKYEDARSCVLAVDNLTGSAVLGRTLRVDHVENYRLPKHVRVKEEGKDAGASSGGAAAPGHAYEGQELASSYDIHSGQDLFARPRKETEEAKEGGSSGDRDRGAEKEDRRRRKEMRAQRRREKEEHRQRKEERRKRRKRDKRKHYDDESE